MADPAAGATALQISLLQTAVFALFKSAPDKEALKRHFQHMSDLSLEASMQYPVSEEAMNSARVMQKALLSVLE